MSFASLYDLKQLQPVFNTSSYGAKTLQMFLENQSARINHRLARRFPLPLTVQATGTLTFSANAVDGDEVTLGNDTYRFKNVPVQPYDIDIGADAAGSALNLVRAINESVYNTGYYDQTYLNQSATASLSGSVVTLKAHKGGPEGNSIPLSETSANIASVAFSGGLREFPQLVLLNVQMATLAAFGGQRNASVSGANVPSGIDFSKQIEETLESLSKGGYILDTDGVVFSASTFSFDSDSGDYPIADMGPVENWGHDDERDWERT
jgi:hypothetical protein